MAIGFSKEQQTGSGNKKIKLPKQKVRKETGELEMFRRIAMKSKPICVHCGINFQEFTVSNFSHIRPKSTHPEERLMESNIQILCSICHNLFDQGSAKQYNERKNLYS